MRLEEALRNYGAPIADAFRPGLDADHLTETLSANGLAPHQDVITWFGWHDAADLAPPARDEHGTVVRYGGETVLVGPWWMFDLDGALSTRRMILEIQGEMVERDGDDELLVPESWLPLATTQGGGDLCIDTAAPGAAPLWIWEPETQDEQTSPQFPSLVEFAGDLTRVLAEGLVVPHAHDDRAAFVLRDRARLPAELRRLNSW